MMVHEHSLGTRHLQASTSTMEPSRPRLPWFHQRSASTESNEPYESNLTLLAVRKEGEYSLRRLGLSITCGAGENAGALPPPLLTQLTQLPTLLLQLTSAMASRSTSSLRTPLKGSANSVLDLHHSALVALEICVTACCFCGETSHCTRHVRHWTPSRRARAHPPVRTPQGVGHSHHCGAR